MTDSSPTPQAQLTDLDYEGHVLDHPPVERVTATVETAEDLYAANEGDLLWIDGTEYAVVKQNFGFFHSPLSIVGEDGTQGRLIGGAINQPSSTAGVVWTRDLPGTDDDRSPQTSDLLARFDRVYRLEENRLDCLHAWTPDSDHRICPACEERSGEPIRIEQQAGKAVELRQCTNTHCQHIYRYVRPFPEPDTATLLISTGSVTPRRSSRDIPRVKPSTSTNSQESSAVPSKTILSSLLKRTVVAATAFTRPRGSPRSATQSSTTTTPTTASVPSPSTPTTALGEQSFGGATNQEVERK